MGRLLHFGSLAVVASLTACEAKPAENPPSERQLETDQQQRQPEPDRPPPALYDFVRFLRQNAERREHATDACYTAENCTYFFPHTISGGGQRLSLPKNAMTCLEQHIPICERAIDDLETYPIPLTVPDDIRDAYMAWTQESEKLRLQVLKMSLEMFEDYGKPLKLKRHQDGYQDFWYYWARKHYPAKYEAQIEISSRQTQMRADGFQALERWLTANGACIEGSRCYPNKIESGGYQGHPRFRGVH